MFSKNTAQLRINSEINAGSMADIAFLLLIFFLVTTTIEIEKGISVKLPPFEVQPPTSIPKRNLFTVLVNKDNELFVRQKEMAIGAIQKAAIEFITNPLQLHTNPKSPKVAVVSLTNDRGASYETYLQVYNELKAAYTVIWEREAQRRFSASYDQASKHRQQQIRNDFPFQISEAEVSF